MPGAHRSVHGEAGVDGVGGVWIFHKAGGVQKGFNAAAGAGAAHSAQAKAFKHKGQPFTVAAGADKGDNIQLLLHVHKGEKFIMPETEYHVLPCGVKGIHIFPAILFKTQRPAEPAVKVVQKRDKRGGFYPHKPAWVAPMYLEVGQNLVCPYVQIRILHQKKFQLTIKKFLGEGKGVWGKGHPFCSQK